MKNKKQMAREGRHKRIRRRISGSSEMLRLVIKRSLKNFYAQAIDDTRHKTVLYGSTMSKEVKEKFPYGGNAKAAAYLGEIFAKKALEQGINKIVFDRAGYLYHGRVKAFGESLRKGGIKF